MIGHMDHVVHDPSTPFLATDRVRRGFPIAGKLLTAPRLYNESSQIARQTQVGRTNRYFPGSFGEQGAYMAIADRDASYRIFKTPPGQYLIDNFLKHVRETGRPETFPGLHHGPIVQTEAFILLKPFEIDRKKRSDGNLAPCPMCQPNKYLRGSLIYLPDLQAVAAIGHCCADKENLAQATQEYRERVARDQEHDYLLAHVPLIPACLAVVAQVLPAAREAERIYRHFRKAGASFQRPLRLVTKSTRLLTVHEHLKSEAAGLAGGRDSASNITSRTIELGYLRGTIAVTNDYNPVRELERIDEAVRPHNHSETDDALLDYVTNLDSKNRHAVTVKLRQAGTDYSRFQNRIANFCDFFAPENMVLIQQWASHPDNPYRFEVSWKGHERIFRRDGEFCRFAIDPVLWTYKHTWPWPT